jgi:RNA polymerase sigma-70 factor (ECF subfamily)
MDQTWLAEVIERAKRREEAAFRALIDAYNRPLYGFLYRLTGNRDDADDLLQEVFVRLVRMIDKYKHDGRFEAWVFRIALNLARDRIRRVRKSPIVTAAERGWTDEEDGERQGLDQAVDDRKTPDEMMELTDQMDRLQGALARLGEAEREVIMLRHFSAMSFGDIAKLMGTPLGTALARAHRGLRRLRQMMEGPLKP